MAETPASHYYICNNCSYPIPVGEKHGNSIECERCGHKEERVKPRSIELTLAFSTTALIFIYSSELFSIYDHRTLWPSQ